MESWHAVKFLLRNYDGEQIVYSFVVLQLNAMSICFKRKWQDWLIVGGMVSCLAIGEVTHVQVETNLEITQNRYPNYDEFTWTLTCISLFSYTMSANMPLRQGSCTGSHSNSDIHLNCEMVVSFPSKFVPHLKILGKQV